MSGHKQASKEEFAIREKCASHPARAVTREGGIHGENENATTVEVTAPNERGYGRLAPVEPAISPR
jgi:hypothetical protein